MSKTLVDSPSPVRLYVSCPNTPYQKQSQKTEFINNRKLTDFIDFNIWLPLNDME